MSVTSEQQFMYHRTNLNIIKSDKLNVRDYAYFLSEPEYVVLGNVIDIYGTRERPNVQRANMYHFVSYMM